MVSIATPLLCGALFFGAGNQATYRDDSCVKSDTYDTPVRISAQAFKYANQCVNNDKFRPVIILEKSSTHIRFANYLHENEFFVATVDLRPEAIEAVFLHEVPFAAMPGINAGHVQKRFRFKQGFEITLQSQKDQNKKLFINDIIMSFEAALPKGVGFNFTVAALKAFPLVGRALSGQQKVLETFEVTGPRNRIPRIIPVKQYEIDYTPREAVSNLRGYLIESNEIGLSLFYDTVSQNCGDNTLAGTTRLPRFCELEPKAKARTMLVGSPIVVGPMLETYQSLGILKGRVQDLHEELNGHLGTKEIEPFDGRKMPLFSNVPHSPVSLIALQSANSSLKGEEQQGIDDVFEHITGKMPRIFLDVMGAVAAAPDITASVEFLKRAVKSVTEELTLRQTRGQLKFPSSTHIMQFYLVPFEYRDGMGLRVVEGQSLLPVPTITGNLTQSNASTVLARVGDGIRGGDTYFDKKLLSTFKAVSLRLIIEPARITTEAQVLLGMTPKRVPFQLKTPQVNFSEFILPTPDDGQNMASALLSFRQVFGGSFNDQVNVEFGTEWDVVESFDRLGLGRLEIGEVAKSCFSPVLSTPTLQGRLRGSNSRSPLQRFLQGTEVSLKVHGLTLDADDLRVTNVRTRLGVNFGLKWGSGSPRRFGLNCLELERINDVVSTQLNRKLEELKKPLLKDILGDGQSPDIPGLRASTQTY